jgi:hypothetical protein
VPGQPICTCIGVGTVHTGSNLHVAPVWSVFAHIGNTSNNRAWLNWLPATEGKEGVEEFCVRCLSGDQQLLFRVSEMRY